MMSPINKVTIESKSSLLIITATLVAYKLLYEVNSLTDDPLSELTNQINS